MKKILIIFLSILLTSCTNTYNYHGEKLIRDLSIIEKQETLEKDFISEGYTIDNPNIIINPYGNSPLTALIIFETEELEKIKVTIKGKNEYTTISHEFKEDTIHHLPIYGLYADYNNEIVIETKDSSYTYYLKTLALPDEITIPTVLNNDINYAHNQMYFLSLATIGYSVGYDFDGEIRYYLKYDNAANWGLRELSDGYYTIGTDRLNNTPYYNTGLYKIDLLGKVYQEINVPDGYHHSVFEMPNGNLLIANNNYDNNSVEDNIIEIDKNTGEVVKSINLKDILPIDQGKSENWTNEDWFHNNSVYYSDKTNELLVSGRHLDIVVSIDYDSLKINYIIGDNQGFSEEMQKYFLTPTNNEEFIWNYSQHAAMILENGDYFIFDNGNNRSKNKDEYLSATNNYSRGVIYNINKEDMTIKQVYQFGKELGSSFYSPYVGDVDELGNNHYIIHSGGIVMIDGIVQNQPMGFLDNTELLSRTYEVIDNHVIYELELENNYYNIAKLPFYTNNTNFTLNTKENIIGSLKDTEIKEILDTKLKDTVAIDNVYDIEVSLQQDRLSVIGTYNKLDMVDLILENKDGQLVYPIPITDNVNGAMCVFIPGTNVSENKLRIAKYINDTNNISGTYQVYLRINGIHYDLDTYFDFK